MSWSDLHTVDFVEQDTYRNRIPEKVVNTAARGPVVLLGQMDQFQSRIGIIPESSLACITFEWEVLNVEVSQIALGCSDLLHPVSGTSRVSIKTTTQGPKVSGPCIQCLVAVISPRPGNNTPPPPPHTTRERILLKTRSSFASPGLGRLCSPGHDSLTPRVTGANELHIYVPCLGPALLGQTE